MALKFISDKYPSQNTYITFIVNAIRTNIDIFVFVSRIFNIHRENKRERLDTIQNTITLTINSVRLQIAQDERNALIKNMINIYQQDNFSDIRSEILEQTVSAFGPFSIPQERAICYLEPTIIDEDRGNYIVGESDNLCDSVFHRTDNEKMEFIECKANIASVIPANLPFEDSRFSRNHRKKVIYLDNVYHYLTQYYVEPSVFFACYNDNYEPQLTNVRENWGFSYFNFLGPLEIHKSVIERTN